jgi:hypothetical protein
MTELSELEEKIRDYAIDEGILGKKLPDNPKLEFRYTINFPPNNPKPMKLTVLKPKDRKAIMIQSNIQIRKEHVDAMNKKDPHGLRKFFIIFQKYMLTKNMLYNIDVKKFRYSIIDTIYPDGLTEQFFYLTIRKVFNTSVFMNMTLMEFIMRALPGKSLKDMDNMNFSSGDSMFT